MVYFQPVDPVQSLIGIHGRNGVTSICNNSGYIYTTGRDGYMRQYKLSGENLELLDKKKVSKYLFIGSAAYIVFSCALFVFAKYSLSRRRYMYGAAGLISHL